MQQTAGESVSLFQKLEKGYSRIYAGQADAGQFAECEMWGQ